MVADGFILYRVLNSDGADDYIKFKDIDQVVVIMEVRKTYV